MESEYRIEFEYRRGTVWCWNLDEGVEITERLDKNSCRWTEYKDGAWSSLTKWKPLQADLAEKWYDKWDKIMLEKRAGDEVECTYMISTVMEIGVLEINMSMEETRKRIDDYDAIMEISHYGLDKYQKFTTRVEEDWDSLVIQVKSMALSWDKEWLGKLNTDLAVEINREADKERNESENILLNTLDSSTEVNWDNFKDKSQFSEEKPSRTFSEPKPQCEVETSDFKEPLETDKEYIPSFSIFEKFSSKKREKKIEKMRQLYLSDYERWQKNNESIARKNVENKDSHEAALKEWEKRKEEFTRSQKNDIELWNNRLEEYLSQQNKKNAEIDELNKLYSAKKPKGVIYYCNQVLCQASYPLDFPLEFGLDYKAETGLLQINYLLPNIEHMPKVKRVEYVKTEGGIVDVNYSNDEKKALNDSYNYQIVLRTMYLLYKADTAGTLNTIRFNGFVTKVDGATGKDLRKTVVSAEIDRQEFLQFNLKIIDPQICVEEYNS